VSSRIVGGFVVVADPARADFLHVYRLLGNSFGPGIQWLGKGGGRPPTPREQAAARTPYRAPAPLLDKSEPDEDDLDDAEALRLCRLEQERAPADLVNVPLAA
jgi:hypothetical protein